MITNYRQMHFLDTLIDFLFRKMMMTSYISFVTCF